MERSLAIGHARGSITRLKFLPVVKFFYIMRAFFGKKNWIVLFAVVALTAVTVLSSGLRDVSFRAGQPLGRDEAQAVGLSVAHFVREIAIIPLWKQLAAWAIVVLIVILTSLLLPPELRRRLIQNFLRYTLILIAIFLAFKYVPGLSDMFQLGDPASGQSGSAADVNIPVPVFVPPRISPAWMVLISVAIAVLIVAAIWFAGRWWRRRRAFLLTARKPLEEMGEIARVSLDELSAGRAWDDVIVDCYMRMSSVVERRRGLVRRDTMTPSEFASRLERSGLPAEAVHKLTRLFERVRYGAQASTQDEIGEAVNCLTAIMNYCGEAA